MGFKFDWFMKGMVLAVLMAYVWPSPGAHGGFLHPELLNKLGVALVFFLNGLSLPLQSLKDGALQWRVHLLIQTCTYLVFPLIGLAVLKTGGWGMSPDLQLGFFYLCALPSTVSSSVALTVAAKGNVPVALFNATLSSLLGVVLTPLWIALVWGQSQNHFDVGPVVKELCLWLLVPLCIGQLARPVLKEWATRHKPRIQVVDRLTILLLVYTSFADTFAQGIWSKHGALVLIETAVGSALLFFAVLLATVGCARMLRLKGPEQIAAVFCGSKKTLASGVPMAHLIFGAHPALGLILMPIMIYHPLQLAVGGVLAQRWSVKPPV